MTTTKQPEAHPDLSKVIDVDLANRTAKALRKTVLACRRCGATWQSRKLADKGEIPVKCPRCGSHVWMVPKNGKETK